MATIRFQAELGHTVVEELEWEEGHDVLAVTHEEAPVVCERRHHGGLDLVNRCHRFEGLGMVRMHGHVIRSWDSETRISHGESPTCLRGAAARSISTPPVCSAISPIEDEIPPAPLSVMLAIRPASRASAACRASSSA